MSHQATYARRFNARAITRPAVAALPIADMTDKQFEAYYGSLPTELARTMAAFARACSRAFTPPPAARP